MLKRIIEKVKDKKGSSTLEFVICMLIFVMVTAFIVDLFIVSYKHYVVSANCTKAVRVLAIQGGISNDIPDNYPGGELNYMNNTEFRKYLNELANTVQGNPGSMKVYLDFSYIDIDDNVIEKKDLLIYEFNHDKSGKITKTYYPQNFLLPYGSFITLRIEYTYQFFYTNIWFNSEKHSKFNSSKSSVTEYVSYDYAYHIDNTPILVIEEDLPEIDTSTSGGYTATDPSYFTYSGNSITGLSEAGKAAGITDLVIPESIDGTVITQIGESAFRENNTITSVVLPSNIKSINAYAFFRCPQLTNIYYNEGLKYIGDSAFELCSNLEGFKPAYNYRDLDVLPDITPAHRIIFPKSLEEVGFGTFHECGKIEIVRFGENIVKIGQKAFSTTNIKSIYFDKPEDSVIGAPWGIRGSVNIAWNSPRVGN